MGALALDCQISKGIGAEICRVFAENFEIVHLMCVFGGVQGPAKPAPGQVPRGVGDMTTTLREYSDIADGSVLATCSSTVRLNSMAAAHQTRRGLRQPP